MKKFYKILVFLWAASILNAATTYVSTITGPRVVTGYFNLTNSVSVIITLDGDDVDGVVTRMERKEALMVFPLRMFLEMVKKIKKYEENEYCNCNKEYEENE